MHSIPSISVVIPNYNGRDILLDTIRFAIRALETSQIIDYEVIVSDDASVDDSIEMVQNNFENVIVVQSDVNTGFSGNVNRGVFSSTKELILLLNSDVHLTEGYFNSLIPLFSNEKTFGVMGVIKDIKSLEIQDGAKYPKLFLYNIESNKNLISENKVLPTFFLSGANALIRASYLKRIGGLCELFNPYYSEDVELGIRVWRMGWEMYFQPDAICYHELSTTIKKINSHKVQLIAKRNKYILHALHLPQALKILYLLNIMLNAIFKLFIGKKLNFLALLSFFNMYSKIRVEMKLRRSLVENKYSLSLFESVEKIKRQLEEKTTN